MSVHCGLSEKRGVSLRFVTHGAGFLAVSPPYAIASSFIFELEKGVKSGESSASIQAFCLSWGSYYPAWQRSSVPSA